MNTPHSLYKGFSFLSGRPGGGAPFGPERDQKEGCGGVRGGVAGRFSVTFLYAFCWIGVARGWERVLRTEFGGLFASHFGGERANI